MYKVGNVGIFILLKFEPKLDVVISHINMNSMQLDKIEFTKNIFLYPIDFLRKLHKNANIANFIYCRKTLVSFHGNWTQWRQTIISA